MKAQSRTVCLVLLVIAALWIVARGADAQPPLSIRPELRPIALQVDESADRVADWSRQATGAFIVFIVTIVLGALTAIIQVVQKSWTRVATVVIGATLSTMTAFSTATFDADYKTLNKRARHGGHLVASARRWLANDAVSIDKVTFEVEKKIRQLDALDTGRVDQPAPAGLQDVSAAVATVGRAAPAFPALSAVVFAADRSQQSAAQKGVPYGACSCDTLDRDDGRELYFCGSATAASIDAAHAAAFNIAVDKATAALKGASSPSAVRSYISRNATEADSCAGRAPQGGAVYAVLLAISKKLATPDAVQAFARTQAPAPPKAEPVANAGGEHVVTAADAAQSTLQIPVRATPARYGDFVFTFAARREGGGVVLRLQDIRVTDDGSAGKTKWRFTLFVDGKAVAALPPENYDDDKKMYRPAASIGLEIQPSARVTILGYRS